MKKLGALLSHLAMLGIGFAAGIYALPILVTPPPPAPDALHALASRAPFTAVFRRDLEGSDILHWGQGRLTVGPEAVTFEGRLAPGPDYKLYLSPEFVQTEAQFMAARHGMVRLGDVRGFDGFIVPVPASVDVTRFTTVVVWCETFGQFISAAQYR